MKPASSLKDKEILQILKNLESQKSAYPPELLAARRAAFLERIEEYEQEVTPAGQEAIAVPRE